MFAPLQLIVIKQVCREVQDAETQEQLNSIRAEIIEAYATKDPDLLSELIFAYDITVAAKSRVHHYAEAS